MANAKDIELAIDTVKDQGNEDILLLHCVSSIRLLLEEYNIRTIPLMRDKFNLMVGLSDHTLGNNNCLGAIALGEVFIEKHFISSYERTRT